MRIERSARALAASYADRQSISASRLNDGGESGGPAVAAQDIRQ
jgi:hypothetical protein